MSDENDFGSGAWEDERRAPAQAEEIARLRAILMDAIHRYKRLGLSEVSDDLQTALDGKEAKP